jgi:DNA-binding response OmpR family regulator
LKKIDPDCVVVIMLTSLANRQTVEESLELGASNYLRKDTPKDEIVTPCATPLTIFDHEGENGRKRDKLNIPPITLRSPPPRP